MGSLMERSDQAISVTELSRSAKTIFEKLAKGEQDRYIVMKNNAPAAVMLPVDFYEAIMDELEDLRIEAVARDRIQTFDPAKAISHEEMMIRFAGGNKE
ncbi:MAG TPA: type II toxin-antitoxin system Phd/YefM family antitoxin [Desulfobacteraceae bacterium]|nr:type II toxin-antitoxin system Phd/YefM family antitoxin [Desulfobacteraceae bacterium]HPJ69117.1 type II toxin-antitoxin system Phd/YefM family antitoxin [Desulfobacteraceae bacterium]HPQ27711.1 type II toxin-antitoxin system Phd/YefM family antitoxin [Desulfobacteraceae bacterium]